MSRTLLRVLLLPVAIFILFTLLVNVSVLVVPLTLCFGWVSAFSRYWNALHANRQLEALFCLALVILVAGSHFFLRWLYRSLAGGREPTSFRAWRFKWTVCLLGTLACSLLAMGSCILTVHQTYWISKSSDPVLTDPFRDYHMMRMASRGLQASAETNHWQGDKVMNAFYHPTSFYFGVPFAESIRPIWISDPAVPGALRAVVLVPQRILIKSRARLIVMEPGKEGRTESATNLLQILASFGVPQSASTSSRVTNHGHE